MTIPFHPSSPQLYAVLTSFLGGPLRYYLPMKVGRLLPTQWESSTVDISVGAQHLYLIDFSGENLPNLKSTIEEHYPDVTVRMQLFVSSYHAVVLTISQVTIIQADAADDKAISDVCQQAIREEGRLDIFFANVRARRWPSFSSDRFFLLRLVSSPGVR